MAESTESPYLALLQVGFAVPPALPRARWALTPPFHPYRNSKIPAVCFLLHFPSPTPHEVGAWPLTSTVLYGARTFLPRKIALSPAVIRPARDRESRSSQLE